jgi:hypothetical protein
LFPRIVWHYFSVFPAASLRKAFNASAAISRRIVFSASGPALDLPQGLTISLPWTILGEPPITATGVIAVIWAVGSPAFSSSLVSAAPQRVEVPQVEVRMTAFTPASLSCRAISCPILLAFSILVATPVVA